METLRTQLRELSKRGEGPKAPRRSDFDTAGLYNDDDDGETNTSTGSETNASSVSPTGTLTLSELQKQTRDIVGKYESAGSGDYNAFNLKDGGHTAIGGDSSKGRLEDADFYEYCEIRNLAIAVKSMQLVVISSLITLEVLLRLCSLLD